LRREIRLPVNRYGKRKPLEGGRYRLGLVVAVQVVEFQPRDQGKVSCLSTAGKGSGIPARPAGSELLRSWLTLVPSAERILLALFLFAFVARAFIPAWRQLNSDFPDQYLAARLHRQGYPADQFYDWIWFERQKDHAEIDLPLVTFIPLTFPSTLLILPWSSLPPLEAKHAWLAVNLLCLGLTAVLMKASTSLPWRRIGLLIFLVFAPLRANLLLGQMHIVVLFLLALAAWLYFEDWSFISGVVVAAAAAIKIYPALFLLFFLVKKQWRAVAGVIVGLGAAAMVSVYSFGLDACRVFAREILPRAVIGENLDPYDLEWNSFTALLRRLFIAEPELNPSPVAHLPSLYAFLHPLIHVFLLVAFLWAVYFATEDRAGRKLQWGCYLFLLLWVSSLPALYHFVALILTGTLVTEYLLERKQTTRAGIFLCLLLLPLGPYSRFYQPSATGWRILLFFPRLYFLSLLGGLLFWILVWHSSESLRSRLRSRSTILATLAFVILTAGSFLSNLHHFRGQFDNYPNRVVVLSTVGMQAEPTLNSRDLFFSALVASPGSFSYAYKLARLRDGSTSTRSGSGDWFHPSAGSESIWVEEATSSSRIVRLAAADFGEAHLGLPVEAEGAEQPVVSPDEELLAFTRELQGVNSLWIRPLGTQRSGGGSASERELAGPEYDARDVAFFPDHRLVFSSKRSGQFRLYAVEPKTGVIREMDVPTCSARYPAISRDGNWLAFSCERSGSWQIHILNLQTGQESQRTDAECNCTRSVWAVDARELIYETDCGRGLGLSALARLRVR